MIDIEKEEELKSSSSFINSTKKYSNYLLPTIGGVTGFFV